MRDNNFHCIMMTFNRNEPVGFNALLAYMQLRLTTCILRRHFKWCQHDRIHCSLHNQSTLIPEKIACTNHEAAVTPTVPVMRPKPMHPRAV